MLIKKSNKPLSVILFQLCIIANAVFGSDAKYYQLSKLVMLAFFAVLLFRIVQKSSDLKVSNIILLPVLFIFYTIISLIWSHNVDRSMTQMETQIQLFILLVFTYLVMHIGATIKDYLDALYVAGFGLAIFGLFRYGGLSNYISVMESGVRIGGEIANENSYGLVFANASLSAAYYIAFKKEKKHIFSIAIFSFFALSSGSKKATLMIVLGIIFVFAMCYGIRRIYKVILLASGCLVIAWVVLQLPIFATINERLMSFLSGEYNKSDASRKNMIAFGLELIEQKPVLGYGLQSFRTMYFSRQYSHNNFVEVTVSLGVIGFVLYYLMYAIPLYRIFLGNNRKAALKDGLCLMLAIWLIVDIVFGYGMVQMYDKPSHILMGVALGYTDNLATGFLIKND